MRITITVCIFVIALHLKVCLTMFRFTEEELKRLHSALADSGYQQTEYNYDGNSSVNSNGDTKVLSVQQSSKDSENDKYKPPSGLALPEGLTRVSDLYLFQISLLSYCLFV